MKDKNFTEVRKWVAKNGDSDTINIFRQLYNSASAIMEPASIPQLVLILADYQYKAAFVADHELNLMAALTEVMAQCKMK
jgi:replication factor C small subunit